MPKGKRSSIRKQIRIEESSENLYGFVASGSLKIIIIIIIIIIQLSNLATFG